MKARIGRLLLETARHLAKLGHELHGLDMSGSYVSLLPLEKPEVLERRMRERLQEAGAWRSHSMGDTSGRPRSGVVTHPGVNWKTMN